MLFSWVKKSVRHNHDIIFPKFVPSLNNSDIYDLIFDEVLPPCQSLSPHPSRLCQKLSSQNYTSIKKVSISSTKETDNNRESIHIYFSNKICVYHVFLTGSAFAIGRGGLEPHHPPGFPAHPDGVPLPFPVFIRPPEILSDERLTIVTPSSVVKNPEMTTKTVTVTSSIGPVTSSISDRRSSGSIGPVTSSISDRRSSGFARKLEEGPEEYETNQVT
jgi:hypothetical protein